MGGRSCDVLFDPADSDEFKKALAQVLVADRNGKLSPVTARWCAQLMPEKREFSREAWDPALRKTMTILHDARRAGISERDRQDKAIARLKNINLVVHSLTGLVALVAAILALLR
jgi:hypothetical protein